jgi:hypothetical protein
MPLLRYFVFVGGALLALLLLISASILPKVPVADATDVGGDKPVIRINSERKWPERVVFDTNLPTIVPVQTAKTDAKADEAVQAPVTVVDASTKARDAFAQLGPSDQKKPEPQRPKKRKIAKKRVSPPTVMVAQQPRFGFFANNIW